MAKILDDNIRRAIGTAHSLRMMQVALAEDDVGTRKKEIRNALKRALHDVVPHDRIGFLQELQTQFPAWQKTASVSTPKDDPKAITDCLVEMGPALSKDQKHHIMQRLIDNGWKYPGERLLPVELKERLSHALGMAQKDTIYIQRLSALALILIEFVKSEHQKIGSVIKDLGAHGRHVNPLHSIQSYVTGKKDVSHTQVEADIGEIQGMMALVLEAYQNAPSRFAFDHLARLKPDEIEAMVRAEGVSFLAGKKASCWDKYVEMSVGLESGKIAREVRKLVAKQITDNLNSIGRSRSTKE